MDIKAGMIGIWNSLYKKQYPVPAGGRTFKPRSEQVRNRNYSVEIMAFIIHLE